MGLRRDAYLSIAALCRTVIEKERRQAEPDRSAVQWLRSRGSWSDPAWGEIEAESVRLLEELFPAEELEQVLVVADRGTPAERFALWRQIEQAALAEFRAHRSIGAFGQVPSGLRV